MSVPGFYGSRLGIVLDQSLLCPHRLTKEFKMKAILRCFVVVLGLSSAVLFAQDTASITGTVSDPSGATVPNAQVTLTEAQKGVSRSATANGNGEYSFA